MTVITIRPGTEEDWDLVEEGLIEGSLLTERPERRTEIPRERLREQARRSIERFHINAKGPEAAFVAEVKGVRAGFVWVTTEVSPGNGESCAWVLEIYVLPEHRRKGIGASLMLEAERWAKACDSRSLWLNAGANNEAAIALYKHMGFDVETVHMSKRF